MQFRLLTVFILFLIVSCSVRQNINAEIEIEDITYSELLKKYRTNSFKEAEYNTVKINGKMSYRIGETSQKLGLNFRIAKGEKIWISGDFLGIPVVKMLVEKDSVHYYNKIDKTYFDGSFEFIEQLVGVDISYEVLEKLIVGDVILNLEKNRYNVKVADNAYYISDTRTRQFFMDGSVYPFTYKTKSQIIEDLFGENSLFVYYNSYQPIDGFLFPKETSMRAKRDRKESIITIDYKDVKFNEKLNFPYKVPKECDKKIEIEEPEEIFEEDE